MLHQSAILLAEDDWNDIFLFRCALEEAGVSSPLSIVRNGQEAIDYLSGNDIYADREKYPWPSAMLLDLNMPVVDGFGVLAWWRKQDAQHDLPIIVLSSASQESDIQRAMALGATAYRVKPADFYYLVTVARELRDHWLKPQEVRC